MTQSLNSEFIKQLTTPNGIKYDQPVGLYINGQFVASKSGKTYDLISPIDEKSIADIQDANEADVDAAVDAAAAAEKEWGELDTAARGQYLYKLADAIEAQKDVFAAVETWDNGKPVSSAAVDVAAVVAVFRNYAGWANKIDGRVIETDKDHFTYTRREPIGICGSVIPWNFPLLMLSWKLGPALACGNVTILKAAESTPLTALLFAKVAHEVGFPPGVINIISGHGAPGAAISAHPRIQKVAFTGSTATGRKILENVHKSNLKNVTLELGGKSANLVFDDADLDRSTNNALAGIFFNQGEVCCAGSRLLVQEGIYDKFLDTLVQKVKGLKVGSPYDKGVFYGAQTNKLQFDKVLSYIEKGKSQGAKLATGGKRFGDVGFFIEPTIFTDVEPSHTIYKEEIFGPVVVVQKFKTVDDGIKLANDSSYGLAAGVQTENLNRAIYVANNLKAGSVWVNTYNDIHPSVPFGGYKESGIGRELGAEALEAYTETKAVRIAGIGRASL